jgi:hypothetical protein
VSEHKKFYVKRRYAYSPNVDLPKDQWITEKTVDGYDVGVQPSFDFDTTLPNLVTSLIEGFNVSDNSFACNNHAVTLDIDHPCELLPSSSPDKYHLYIHKPINWYQYLNIMKAFVQAGIVEEGFVTAAKHNKFTALRLPGVTKPGISVTNSNTRRTNAVLRREAFLNRQHAVRYHRLVVLLMDKLKDVVDQDEFTQMLEEVGLSPFAVPNPVYT